MTKQSEAFANAILWNDDELIDANYINIRNEMGEEDNLLFISFNDESLLLLDLKHNHLIPLDSVDGIHKVLEVLAEADRDLYERILAFTNARQPEVTKNATH